MVLIKSPICSSNDIAIVQPLQCRKFECKIISDVSKIKKSIQGNINFIFHTFRKCDCFCQDVVSYDKNITLRKTCCFFSKIILLENVNLCRNISQHRCLLNRLALCIDIVSFRCRKWNLRNFFKRLLHENFSCIIRSEKCRLYFCSKQFKRQPL